MGKLRLSDMQFNALSILAGGVILVIVLVCALW